MKPKVLFVYDMKDPSTWMDGLYMALQELEKDFDIVRRNIYVSGYPRHTTAGTFDAPTYAELDYSPYVFVLGWGGFNSSVDKAMQQMPIKKGLCIGGYGYPATGMENYDVLFYETKWGRDYLNLHTHPNIVHAFGINTEIYFKPDIPLPIVYDYIGVGSFSSWKRWDKMKDKKGIRLVIGEYQNDNEQESLEIVRDLVKNKVIVSNTQTPFDLSNMMMYSRTAYMPSTVLGGGERFVLEARACGLKVEIEDDNPKLQELLDSPIYDYKYYAKQLKKGIEGVL